MTSLKSVAKDGKAIVSRHFHLVFLTDGKTIQRCHRSQALWKVTEPDDCYSLTGFLLWRRELQASRCYVFSYSYAGQKRSPPCQTSQTHKDGLLFFWVGEPADASLSGEPSLVSHHGGLTLLSLGWCVRAAKCLSSLRSAGNLSAAQLN